MSILLLSLLLQVAAPTPCPARPQPLPVAIESVGEDPPASGTIAFAATPWDHPGRAWVIRLSRRGPAARLEIVRLLQRSDCNMYDVEWRREGALPLMEYRRLAQAVAAWARPPDGFPLKEGDPGLALDGTSLILRVRTTGWQLTRALTYSSRSGAGLSAIFRVLLTRHVPAAELPAADWRRRRR
jgi:hypothetical protein